MPVFHIRKLILYFSTVSTKFDRADLGPVLRRLGDGRLVFWEDKGFSLFASDQEMKGPIRGNDRGGKFAVSLIPTDSDFDGMSLCPL